MLLRVIAVEAEIAARSLRDRTGSRCPPARPSRAASHSTRAARLLEPLPIAREHLEVGEQIVRPQNRLRAPQMRVAGDHRVGILARPVRAALASRPSSSAFARIDLLAQPQARIERNLLVAAAAGVDLVRKRRRPFLSACG